MQADRDLLAKLTKIVLDEKRDGKTLRPEILAIKDIFDRICDDFTQGETAIEWGETLTAQGLAISPQMAAMCLEDYYRTIIYLRGLSAAITDVKRQRPDRALRVLYVGTGPYAILAIPLMAVYPPESVIFEFLDINAVSLESARSIITHLGLTDCVSAYHHTDAMDYQPSEDALPDIIIAEIMLAGLEKEPQVAVTRALTARMPESLFLPQSIDISAVTYEPRRALGPIFRFDKNMFSANASQNNTLPAKSIKIPEGTEETVFLETRIHIYGSYVLNPDDSGLTTRRILPCDHESGDLIDLVYQMGEWPGLSRVQ